MAVSDSSSDFAHDASRDAESLVHLVLLGLEDLAGVAEAPGVLGERRALPQNGLESRLVLQAGDSQLADVVRLPKWATVAREERLERLLHRLLTMEGRVSQQRWLGREIHLGCAEIRVARANASSGTTRRTS